MLVERTFVGWASDIIAAAPTSIVHFCLPDTLSAMWLSWMYLATALPTILSTGLPCLRRCRTYKEKGGVNEENDVCSLLLVKLF